MIRVLAGIALFVSVPAGLSAQATQPDPVITATGRGEIRLKPTKAAITFTVQTKNALAAGAASENAKIVSEAMRALRGAGLRDEDMTIVSYSVGPNYDFSAAGRKQDGFLATHGIRAEIADVASVGKVIDAGLAGGATMVSSAQYMGDNVSTARVDALKAAVADARRDAEAIAIAAGGSLGRLLSMMSTQAPPNQMRDTYYETSGVAYSTVAPTMVRPNDITVAAGATGRWEFIPRR